MSHRIVPDIKRESETESINLSQLLPMQAALAFTDKLLQVTLDRPPESESISRNQNQTPECDRCIAIIVECLRSLNALGVLKCSCMFLSQVVTSRLRRGCRISALVLVCCHNSRLSDFEAYKKEPKMLSAIAGNLL